jgi:serine/threonine protein kinase
MGGVLCSPELRELVGSMIQKDPRKRPSVNDILALPIVKQRIAHFLSEVGAVLMNSPKHMVAFKMPRSWSNKRAFTCVKLFT